MNSNTVHITCSSVNFKKLVFFGYSGIIRNETVCTVRWGYVQQSEGDQINGVTVDLTYSGGNFKKLGFNDKAV